MAKLLREILQGRDIFLYFFVIYSSLFLFIIFNFFKCIPCLSLFPIFKVKAIDNAGNCSNILEYKIIIDYKGNVLDKNSFIIYPTISNNDINIKYNLNVDVNKVLIQIRDSGGKMFKEIEAINKSGETIVRYNISNLANGVYFVKIIANKKDGISEHIVKKFIVKK